jgi:putative nucleotidyltransferase with HDIG domain
MTDTSQPYQIAPEQLCIGLYVHIDLPWIDHPFTFSSFKIKSLEQIATIQSLGLRTLRYAPNKSDAEPLPMFGAPGEGFAAPSGNSLQDDPSLVDKRARVARLRANRESVGACEKELLSTARTIKSINQNLFAKPEEARQAATALVGSIAESMLVDVDIAIHLMADKIGNEEVYLHSLNVTLLSMMLAKELKAPPAAIQLLGLGALFHDIGKVDIPDRVTRKTEPLSHAEFGLLQQHVPFGVEIGRKMGLPPEALLVIAQHHEQVDGGGYPKKLVGSQISLLARVVGLVNAYDNLCNPVNLAKALTPHEALSVLYGQQRARFDANAMGMFVRCMGVYPPGTLVLLSNGTLALVVSVNSSKPLKPTVRIYDPAVPKEEAIVVDLEQEPDVTIAKALRPQQLPQAAYDYLAPRKNATYYFSADQRAGG